MPFIRMIRLFTHTRWITTPNILLMVQKSGDHHLGCIKTLQIVVYQPPIAGFLNHQVLMMTSQLTPSGHPDRLWRLGYRGLSRDVLHATAAWRCWFNGAQRIQRCPKDSTVPKGFNGAQRIQRRWLVRIYLVDFPPLFGGEGLIFFWYNFWLNLFFGGGERKSHWIYITLDFFPKNMIFSQFPKMFFGWITFRLIRKKHKNRMANKFHMLIEITEVHPRKKKKNMKNLSKSLQITGRIEMPKSGHFLVWLP